MNLLQTLVGKAVKGYEDKSLLAQAAIVANALHDLVDRHNKLESALDNAGASSLWVNCGSCSSPVLHAQGECPYCGNEIAANAKKEDVVEEVAKEEVKPAEKKASKKAASKKKPEPVVEEEPEPAPEETEEEEDDFPSVDEVNKMKTAGLKKLVKAHELDVDLDDYDNIKDKRQAVNDAIEAICSGEGDDEELSGDEDFDDDGFDEDDNNVDDDLDDGVDEEEDVPTEATDAEVDDFDLDDIEDDDSDVDAEFDD